MPKTIAIENKDRTRAGALRVKYCNTFLCQLRGLSFRPRLAPDEGLLLVGKRDSRIDSSIHMFFVPFDLTVIWIDSSLQVVDKVLARAWRPAYFSKRPAQYTLELHAARWDDFEVGDGVMFRDA
ncbi:MAG: DUF192 domain-containing protein [Chloroflexota bacterium]|nr:DUF192 domain-containing protein [Chloroflexota bacterium]